MKKAVIQTGGKQYVVSEGETLNVELIKSDGKTADFEPLLVIDGDNVQVGTPTVSKAKVTAIRYKAKKRVRKVRGHRQHQTVIKIKSIV